MKNIIRHIRENRGYSQKYINKRIGKGQVLISKIENGYICLSEKAIERMEGANSLNDLINHLLNKFVENKKLLHEVELNQKKLQEELKLLQLKLIEKTPTVV
ncbi:MAG: helix-turn-helix transcriptional regulator [Ginsengibacter sp.]